MAATTPPTETLTWRPISELPAAYPEVDHDIYVLLWSPETGPAAHCLYGKDAGDFVTADTWTFWAAVRGPSRPSTEALVEYYGEDAVKRALAGWDSGVGAEDDFEGEVDGVLN